MIRNFCYNFAYKQPPKKAQSMKLTHINDKKLPKMVDVGAKDISSRIAVASGVIKMSKEAYELAQSGTGKKGPVMQTAVISAIMAAKRTSESIAMAHPIAINGVDIDIAPLPDLPGFKLSASVKTSGKTGVEMEALHAVSVGLLNIYDMLKAADKAMLISDIFLEHKSGGKSGEINNNLDEIKGRK